MMEHYGLQSLEDVFLLLCKHTDTGEEAEERGRFFINTHPPARAEAAAVVGERAPLLVADTRLPERRESVSDVRETGMPFARKNVRRSPIFGRQYSNASMYAIAARKVTSLRKHLPILIFAIMTPCFELVMLGVVMGPNPHNLNIGVVNQDAGSGLGFSVGDAIVKTLKDEYDDSFNVKEFGSVNAANEAVRRGGTWGTVFMDRNFTAASIDRYLNCVISPAVSQNSAVQVYLDFSNQQIAFFILRELNEALFSTAEGVLGTAVAPPINVVEPAIFGSPDVRFIDFIGPNMIVALLFSFSLAVSSLSVVQERISATLDRIYSCGTGSLSLLVAHIFAHLGLLFLQMVLLLFIALVVFSIPNHGSLFHLVMIAMMLGISGMALGTVLAAFGRSEFEVVQLSLFIVFATLLSSGILWPLEAAPLLLQLYAYTLPPTWCAAAYRSVMTRGWGIESSDVYGAYIITFVWGVGLLFGALHVIRPRIGESRKELPTNMKPLN